MIEGNFVSNIDTDKSLKYRNARGNSLNDISLSYSLSIMGLLVVSLIDYNNLGTIFKCKQIKTLKSHALLYYKLH